MVSAGDFRNGITIELAVLRLKEAWPALPVRR